jgi:succinate dehydrogenase / fumarate reductase cytochrome b subunit
LVLKVAAQQRILRWAWALMILVTFLGLAAIWGTYWLNLKA